MSRSLCPLVLNPSKPVPEPDTQQLVHNRAKSQFDADQLAHILDLEGFDAPGTTRELIEQELTLARQRAFQEEPEASEEALPDHPEDPLFNRILHIRPPPVMGSLLLTTNPLNPDLDLAAINAEYESNRLVVVDDILRPDVIEELRKFCLESTIWHNVKPTFVGAYWDKGFSSPLLLHVASALMAAFPFLSTTHLEYFWAYAYNNQVEQDNPAIDIHADEAKVNFNLWLTPDDFNLDPDSGGLTVWREKVPADWSFQDFNSPRSVDKVKDWLGGVTPTQVSYKYNRAAIFDSDFFHQSQLSTFRPGHGNRRINLSFLFGSRQQIMGQSTGQETTH